MPGAGPSYASAADEVAAMAAESKRAARDSLALQLGRVLLDAGMGNVIELLDALKKKRQEDCDRAYAAAEEVRQLYTVLNAHREK